MTDIWKMYGDGCIAVIPTNLMTDKKGHAVMGAGLAKQVKERFPEIPEFYGNILTEYLTPARGNVYASKHELIFLPTKTDWRKPSDLGFIAYNLTILSGWKEYLQHKKLAMPRIGCGLGELDWADVKPLIELLLADFNIEYCNP